jgi:hypothetical protein
VIEMGEAVYYLKARFESREDVERAMPQVVTLIKQGIEAQEWWQEHRNMEQDDRPAFWKEFVERFPAVTEYLGETGHSTFRNSIVGGDCNNELSGELDFGCDESDLESIMICGNEIWYSALVWHFADWTRLAESFYRFGAKRVGWISDEDMNPYNVIDLGE